MRFFSEHRRVFLAVGSVAVSLLAFEELRYGRILGVAQFPCEFMGGKFASAESRCVTRACYWFDDCGYWAGASHWRERVSPGDAISTVVFWLGQPSGKRGETYFWDYGKPGGRYFATTFRDGRFVEWRDDAQKLLPLKKITLDEARTWALIHLSQSELGTEFILVPGKAREYPFGWVFFDAFKKNWKTDELVDENPRSVLLAVDFDGSVHPLATSGSPDAAIADHLQSWRERQKLRMSP
ncbi:hypothetical protein M2322_003210 [Rhodoblastus acidophilus]|uniref:hypothetical protein n=1 Tax=Rhodoblastus acidophilus TaxID=1074 RepID=UPI002224F146|nr:hypothetical protein [Rhodoblastus acidophilus]MCW2317646.1 hypothetical protein [Rhodoblastus acidophilus]